MLEKYYKTLQEAESENKYFYIIGDAEEGYSYFDSDTGYNIPDYRTLDNGYFPKERYATFKEVCDLLVDEGYYNIYEKINFPNEYNLEEIEESDCTPNDLGPYIELCSYWCEREEEFGPEYHERTAIVSRLIQICKEK